MNPKDISLDTQNLLNEINYTLSKGVNSLLSI